MPNPQRLDVLRQLREAAQLTQADMALICGLRGRQSHQTAGAWERGTITPDARRRKRFIGYLWDDLGLRRDPERFEAVWRILVEEWGWQPIDAAEWAAFTHTDRPGVDSPDPTSPDATNEEESPAAVAPYGAIRRMLDVAFYTSAEAVRGRPSNLVGRAALLAQVYAHLDAKEHVLLHGLGGAGKTVLAATAAAARIEAGHGAVIWLHAGNAPGAMLYTALVEHFLPPPERGALRDEGGLIAAAAVAELLARLSPGLIVADDVWDGTALYQLMQALPPDVPLLVTSRLRFPRMARIEVGDLAPNDAVMLLAHTAGRRSLGQDEAAHALCATLGFHPYALEIAGTVLELDPLLTPARLQQQIAQAPHAIPMPAGFAAEGRVSVKYLLDHSFTALDPAAQDVLAAFGLLYAPGATATLLAAILDRDGWAVETALRELSVRSLARQTRPGYYELHDLTFSYVQALDKLRAASGALVGGDAGVNAAIARYVTENSQDFATLELDQANVLGAADAARIQDPPVFLSIMADLAQGGYFDARGHTQQHMGLLDEAIALTVEPEFADEELRHYLLSKRGNTLVAEGGYDRAITVYEAALACAPSTARRITLEAVLGKTHALVEQHDAAARRFQVATQLAEAHNDIESLCTVLMQQSHAAAQAKDFATERDLALRGVQLSKQHGRLDDIGYFYLNLGSAEYEIGVHEALARHQDAYNYAVRADNEALLALAHRALGMDYLGLEDVELASSHLEEALRLFEKVGHADEVERLRRFIIGFGALAEKLNSGGEL